MKLKKLKGWFTVTDIQIGPITSRNQLTNERITMSRVDNDYTEAERVAIAFYILLTNGILTNGDE